MRILLISPTLGMGGSELLVTVYARHLAERGHEVTVAYGLDASRLPELTRAGIEVVRLSDRRLGSRTLVEWWRSLRAVISRVRPDALHAQSVTASLVAACAAPRLPLLVTIHGIDASHERLAALILRLGGARVTAVSRGSASGIERHVLAPRVEVLPPGIEYERVQRAAEEPVDEGPIGTPHFCCVARHHPAKGVDLVIRSFAEVRQALPEARLTLVGSGPEIDRNLRLARDLELLQATAFIGEVKNAAPYLRRGDVTVLASRREGLPVVALESLALGRPVVASDVGGTPTVVRDGSTGWLVPPGDRAALTGAMVAAGSDLDEARRRGRAGHALVRKSFDVEVTVGRIQSLLLELSRGRADRGTPQVTGGVSPVKPRPYYRAVRLEQKVRILGARIRSRAHADGSDGVRILGYHRVSDDDDAFAIPPRDFVAQMEAVLRSGATPVRLDAALDLLDRPLEERYVCVTFDDGFRDNLTNAAPVLRELGIPATVFLPTGVLDRATTYYWYRDPPPALSWDEVADLVGDELIDVQPHSRLHLSLPALDDAGAREEIERSKHDIEQRLSRPATIFCYPAGLYGPRETHLLREAGYRAAVTTRAGINPGGASLFELRRTMIKWRDSLSDFEAKLSGLLDKPALPAQALERRRSRPA